MLVLTALLVLTPLAFDKLLLKDGRMIEGKVLTAAEAENCTTLEVKGLKINVREDLIAKTFIEDLADYVPKNKQEEDYLKKGWVIFEGTWMSAKNREKELQKRKKADEDALQKQVELQKWKNAIVEETPHFTITSNAAEDILERYTSMLETYYRAFVDFWGITLKPGSSKDKMKVFIYRTEEDFHRIGGAAGNVKGFFNWYLGELHVYWDQYDPEYVYSVLFHEGNHLLTYFIDPGFLYPIWLNEGMAEYYGTARVGDDGDFAVGRQQDGRIVTLKRDQDKNELLRLKDVLLCEREDFTGREYAYAWSFVHFLMQSPDYGKTFQGFFGNLPNNKDVNHNIVTIDNQGHTKRMVELSEVLAALEKRLGRKIEQLEKEWLAYLPTYGELGPEAWFRAGQLAMYDPNGNAETVRRAAEFFDKAVSMGIGVPECYRTYAELLRKGGVIEMDLVEMPLDPDPVKAWQMIQKAIELDPVSGISYMEAAGILILDSQVQDLEKAVAMAETAKAVEPRNYVVRLLYDDFMSLVEPARETLRERAEIAAADPRDWMVQPYFVEGEAKPETIDGLTTLELEELIRDGTCKANDWVYQSWRESDPETGELLPGSDPWDEAWTEISKIPEFADELAAATSAADETSGAAPR